MPRFPEWTRIDLEVRITRHVREHWPRLEGITVRFRGGFAYLDARLPHGEVQPLCHLPYDGSETEFGFALWRPSHNDYEDTILPGGDCTTTAETAFDTAASFYLTGNEALTD